MWWEPRSNAEETVSQTLTRFLEGFSAYARDREVVPLVWGVGSTIDAAGRLVPLVLANVEAYPILRPIAEVGDVSFGSFDFPTRIRSLLSSWEAPPITAIRALGRPVPATSLINPGARVIEHDLPTRSSSVGLPCRLINEPNSVAFITAGHGVSNEGDLVEVLSADLQAHIGVVRHISDPALQPGVPGYDYAVVEMVTNGVLTSIDHTGPAFPPRAPYVPINVSITGAFSGQRWAMVDGAITQLGDANRQWSNCWSLGPSYTLQLGDSGSVAIGMPPGPWTKSILGHFVGGSYWPGADRPGLVHLFVQDFASSLAAGLDQLISI